MGTNGENRAISSLLNDENAVVFGPFSAILARFGAERGEI
jgi:hypothetical protein